MGSTSDNDKTYATQINYRSSLAALTWLLYDICITLDDEIKLVWPKPWTRMKVLFLFIRYVPLFVQISILVIGSPELTPRFHFTAHACFIWQVYQGVASLVIFAAVDYVLILRVYALYHNNKTLQKLVLVVFALEVSAMCIGLGLSFPGIQFDEICVVESISKLLLISGLTESQSRTAIIPNLLFGLTVYKFIHAVRNGWSDTPLVSLIMRDGTWAFFMLFAILVGAASLYSLKNHFFTGIVYGWLLSVFSFAGYRVLLNLDRIRDGPRLPTNQTTANDSLYQFTTRIMTDGEADAPQLFTFNTGTDG
ncbi:hypothetical protein GGX14DRAFT_631518 [Mycena pura]|uniref:DUF6533 domain-containing protein n=1 Tax=Mycena pura TaxID=153505 RepID=A0AAD6YA63_9AGAR|nr:hypothetical protein GGX14DRAFT_631518 [Mycena pura]